mmetsp:Transcript_44770/g.129488  ORF Transcript_44770/g.129488 Transcript_44770/m.129488 type:complete len:103 (+) Transcript_44770:515-823(+)
MCCKHLTYVPTTMDLPVVILRQLRDRDLEGGAVEMLLEELLQDEETQAVLSSDISLAAAALHSLGAQVTFPASRPSRTTAIAAVGRAAFATLLTCGPSVTVV